MPPLTSVPFGAPYYSAQLQTNCLLVVSLNGSTTRTLSSLCHRSGAKKGPAPPTTGEEGKRGRPLNCPIRQKNVWPNIMRFDVFPCKLANAHNPVRRYSCFPPMRQKLRRYPDQPSKLRLVAVCRLLDNLVVNFVLHTF